MAQLRHMGTEITQERAKGKKLEDDLRHCQEEYADLKAELVHQERKYASSTEHIGSGKGQAIFAGCAMCESYMRRSPRCPGAGFLRSTTCLLLDILHRGQCGHWSDEQQGTIDGWWDPATLHTDWWQAVHA
jgi:hypothetical protein